LSDGQLTAGKNIAIFARAKMAIRVNFGEL
jgi:hypothetical protein